VAGWPIAELDANKSDIEGNYLKTLEMARSSRTGAPRHPGRAVRGRRHPNFFRTAVRAGLGAHR
jgi:hypothetical protein